MNWENIVLAATVGCSAIVLWDVVARLKAGSNAGATVTGAPPQAWLEIAYPLGFIALMGLLVLHSVMSFAAILLLATVITGIIWGLDALLLARKRAGKAAEPVLVEMAKSFFPVILVVFLLRSFLVEPFKIPSGSMLPSLLIGDFILVNKFTYGIRIPVLNKKVIDIKDPKRGEVMVFRYPEDPSKDFIKRIVGLPGDVITYRGKRVSINGKPVTTEQLGTITEVDDRANFHRYDAYREKLGDTTHVMMVNPDRPNLVSGVRQFPNKKNCEYNDEGLTCKVPSGHYFMMGDNRDNSDDSRYWGFVPEQNIVGKAFLVWMNFGNLKRIGTAIE